MLRNLIAVCAVASLAAACHGDGAYEVAWQFEQQQSAAQGCGAHGIFGVRVTGLADDGSGSDTVSPCAPGKLSQGVPPGTWQFVVHALDAQGRFKEPDDADQGGVVLNVRLDPVAIAEGVTVALADGNPVTFVPQPECRDGIDNDRDGRVDLDDPDCVCADGPSELDSVPCPAP